MNFKPYDSVMTLAAETHMGRLELRVRDMDTMFDYYRRGVGLTPLHEEKGAVTLGLDGKPGVLLQRPRGQRRRALPRPPP